MAFVDRVVDHPGRVRLTPVSGQSDVYDMTREEGTVTQDGTLLNALNLNTQTQVDNNVMQLFTNAGAPTDAQNDLSNALKLLIGLVANAQYQFPQTEITSYSSSSNMFTVPKPGVIKIECNYRSGSYIQLWSAGGYTIAQGSAPSASNLAGSIIIPVPVFAGMQVYVQQASSGYSHAYYVPFSI